MNEVVIPGAETIPVHWLWFQILLLFTFLIHIILMNLILGGSLLAMVDSFRKKDHNKLSLNIPTILALAINFGVPPLLFVQVLYGNFFYSSSVVMAGPWLLVIPIIIIAYYAAYIFVIRKENRPKLSLGSLILSSILLLIVAFIYVNNNTLMLNPEQWWQFAAFNSGWHLNLSEATLIPRYLHFVVGAIAVASLGKASWYRFFAKKELEGIRQEQIQTGLKNFAWATGLQILVGIWFLITLPGEIMMQFMGQNLIYTLLLIIGIALGLMALIFGMRKRFMPSLIILAVVLVIMIVIRELVRQSYLGKYFAPSTLEVTGQSGPLIFFLLVFLAGAATIFYMIKLLNKPEKNIHS